eukprot:CAMPEP_0203667616 /NCGR_PEP_ID=MMETSP0090-20130426/4423_1 /ASSEMBLY_ACC=CAM_ASM_001088 /TAXON_ID=426623 /ORGANISM="Chaetoceros affinis, Strain CCMP159" /LENGTH=615 /DNA_ID=CAMNT_0050531831 /DNA_START=769 /DNA_END=2616 /DNA_ORIENTATION=-
MSISKCSIGFGVSAFITDIIDPKTLIQTPKHSSATISATRYRRRHGHIHALRQQEQILFGLQMSSGGANSNANAGDGGDEDERRNPKKDLIDNELNGNHNDVKKQNLQSKAAQTQTEKEGHDNNNNNDTTELKSQNEELLRRITQLEALAGSQAVQLRKLREECDSLKDAALAFSQIVELLRQAGLTVDQLSQSKEKKESSTSKTTSIQSKTKKGTKEQTTIYENIDEAEIFGSAPASVSDAADSAGASILAALLGGKHRMLVDVRDAELSRDPDVLVQFIELAILPVAAGLEGLKTQKNRVKIVFPTVSQLMQYRKTMALAAPEVVSLSTLGFDPVEKRDNLVVIIAPSPDDEEGLLQMNELLSSDSIRQPVVVLNHHMVPLSGPGGEFEPIYHLRLLTVQYMAGDTSPGSLESKNNNRGGKAQTLGSNEQEQLKSNVTEEVLESSNTNSSNVNATQSESGTATAYTSLSPEKEDAALAAAMEHAHELGIHQGVTRAMVIRAYPRPWHVFVDTSPDTDADFEVAATFDEYPSQDDINYAIVECLEGSEREDELVAQQMQEAIESGQLNSISDMLGLTNMDNKLGSGEGDGEEDDEDEDDDFYNDWDPWFGADTV